MDIEYTLLPTLFPLKLTFQVSSELHMQGGASGALDAEIGYMVTTNATTGVERKDGEWVWVKENELSGELWGPVYTGEKNLTASATLTNRVSLVPG